MKLDPQGLGQGPGGAHHLGLRARRAGHPPAQDRRHTRLDADVSFVLAAAQRFQGKPADVVRALKAAVGEGGLLVMPSMPYHNMSSAQWLAKGKPMNVLRSPSMMGLVSEVFRRSEGVQRSLSLTHPLLAWGRDAAAFVEGHERAERSFGDASPFARLLARDALILGFDAPFSTFTYTHFVEDQLADTLPFPLRAAAGGWCGDRSQRAALRLRRPRAGRRGQPPAP
jgi:hypothetical protein